MEKSFKYKQIKQQKVLVGNTEDDTLNLGYGDNLALDRKTRSYKRMRAIFLLYTIKLRDSQIYGNARFRKGNATQIESLIMHGLINDMKIKKNIVKAC